MADYSPDQEAAIEAFAEESRLNLVISTYEDIMPGATIALGGLAVLSGYGVYEAIQAGKPLAALGFAVAGGFEGWASYKVGKATINFFETVRNAAPLDNPSFE